MIQQLLKEFACLVMSHDLGVWRDDMGLHMQCQRCGWIKK